MYFRLMTAIFDLTIIPTSKSTFSSPIVLLDREKGYPTEIW